MVGGEIEIKAMWVHSTLLGVKDLTIIAGLQATVIKSPVEKYTKEYE